MSRVVLKLKPCLLILADGRTITLDFPLLPKRVEVPIVTATRTHVVSFIRRGAYDHGYGFYEQFIEGETTDDLDDPQCR